MLGVDAFDDIRGVSKQQDYYYNWLFSFSRGRKTIPNMSAITRILLVLFYASHLVTAQTSTSTVTGSASVSVVASWSSGFDALPIPTTLSPEKVFPPPHPHTPYLTFSPSPSH